MIEKPTIELREWLRRDVLVELWETRPRIIEKKLEDETIVKEVAIDQDSNKPIVDKRIRGILKVNLS